METASQTTSEKVVEVVLAYYRQADGLPNTYSAVAAWLAELNPDEMSEALPLGLHASRLPAFKRYLLESYGYSMEAYIGDHLTPAERSYWVDDNDGGVQAT